MSKASMKTLEGLHELLASYYAVQLESGEELSSGTLAAINTFLKNNDVRVDIVDSNPMQDLTKNLQALIEVRH